MNKTKFLSLLLLTVFVSFLFPTVLKAQRDAFISEDYDGGIYREDPVIGWTIVHQGIGENSPLGSGLLVMVAAGAGYAVLRRKRRNMSKYTSLILALVLLLGLTQCKKKLETIHTTDATPVNIILNVNDGSKVEVTPGFEDPITHEIYASVEFENGDVIYVGNNGKYCGYITYDGSYFSGTIYPTSADDIDYLHFYFMGNKTPENIKEGETSAVTLVENSTTKFDVDINDQTIKYPVISYSHSNELYNSGRSEYSTKLQNKCSIVKFATNEVSTDIHVKISGMNNMVTVNFAANIAATTGEPYSYGMAN